MKFKLARKMFVMEIRPVGITLIMTVYFILGGLSLLWSGLVFGWG